jgi:TonB-dependent starch-binding outer membrane protein SusC
LPKKNELNLTSTAYSFNPNFTKVMQSHRFCTQMLLAMRLTILLLTAAFLQVSAHTEAQTISLNVKDAPITSVFSSIEHQTGYAIFYNKEFLKNAKLVSVQVIDMKLEDFLKLILSDQPLTYEIYQQNILIKKKDNQTIDEEIPPIDVHGHVTDSLGNPLAGATVTVKGSKSASTSTDANGDFSLHAINSNATLVISNIGFETQEIKLKGKSGLTAKMKVHSTSLLDVVVNKGYYNTTQRLNTGDVSTVSGVDIQKQPVTDPIQALEGRVAGLNIQQTSGVPGANNVVRIRGVNSLFSGLNPFYIVDGVPFSSTSLTSPFIGGGVVGTPVNGQGMSPFNIINPADIERIDVLKDADATAIYGSRGANGVILITTKKGKPGDTKFDVAVTTGFSNVTRELPMLNTQQYLSMRHEAFNNDGTVPSSYDYDVNGVWDTTRYTNWQKVFIVNDDPFTNVQANISGGNANTQFVIGGGYNRQSTLYPGDYYDQKASLHASINNNSLNQRFHTQLSVNYANDNSNLPQNDLTQFITLAPDAPSLYDANGNLNWQVYQGSPTWKNPLVYTLQHANAITDFFSGNLILSYDLLPGLQLLSSFGYSNSGSSQSLLTPGTFYPPPFNNSPYARSSYFSTTNLKTSNFEPQVNYHKKIGEGKLEALVGTTFQENIFSSSGQSASGFSSDALITNPSAATIFGSAGNAYTLYHYNALFGRISYNWQEKYLINITARRDGSSRFGPGKQFGNFGAVGIGWIFTTEPFIQNSLPFLSFGKLRVSYGSTGNDQIGDYQFLSTYQPNSLSYAGLGGLTPVSLTNPNFSWERVYKFEPGIELGFAKGRIFFSSSYYLNRTNNQLIPYPLPVITGFSSVQQNSPAIIQNSGIEFVLDAVNIKGKDFTWRSSLNLSIQANKLLSYPGLDSSSYAYYYSIGKSLFSKAVYQYTGVNPQNGVYTFDTKNANGQPSYPQDLIWSKPVTQKFYGGFNNSFSYKGFQLDIFFQFVSQLGYNYSNAFPYAPGIFNENQPTYVLNRWQRSGDHSNTQQFTESGSSLAQMAYNNFALFPSNGVITDASFIRLKNLALSYQLPISWEKAAHLQNLRIYLQCQNLLTITGYQGIDPETQGLGLPPLRTITAGIQIVL